MQEDDSSTNQLTPAEQLSVRERMQHFNKMATETDLPARPSVSSPSNKKRTDKVLCRLLLLLFFFFDISSIYLVV